MAVDSISSASPLFSASAMQGLNKPAVGSPAELGGQAPSVIGSLSLSPLNGPHENGSASIRTGLQIVPSPNEAAAALQSSAQQIARLQSNPEQPTAQAAAAAYQTQAGAQTQIAPRESSVGPLKINIVA